MRFRKILFVSLAVTGIGVIGSVSTASADGPSEKTRMKVDKATQNSLDALDKVLEKVPDASRATIEEAKSVVIRTERKRRE